MSKKQPALSTQLKAAQACITALEKKLSSETASKDTFYRQMNDAKAELEQVHALLDVLPGAAKRKTEAEESWQRQDIALMTRLAAYLAARQA